MFWRNLTKNPIISTLIISCITAVGAFMIGAFVLFVKDVVSRHPKVNGLVESVRALQVQQKAYYDAQMKEMGALRDNQARLMQAQRDTYNQTVDNKNYMNNTIRPEVKANAEGIGKVREDMAASMGRLQADITSKLGKIRSDMNNKFGDYVKRTEYDYDADIIWAHCCPVVKSVKE